MKALNLFAALFFFAGAAYAQVGLTAADLAPLEGEKWIGELTYLDYRSGKKTSIKSNLTVTKKGDSRWSFIYEYPDEPKADSTGEVALIDEGRNFNGQNVVSKRMVESGTEIITEKEGEDNGKKALFRYTYTFMSKSFSLRKDVRAEGATEWFERNAYNWFRR